MARGFDYTTTLGTCWLKRENGLNIYYPRKVDGWIVHDLLNSDAFKEFRKEIEGRGYDFQTASYVSKIKGWCY